MTDADWMQRCLELARRAEGRTAPNPAVGCVVVSPAGKLVAEGYHERAGEPHAEAVALRRAGTRARGATLYVNLEPCRHRSNRRTQPCAPLLVQAGIARLVFGMRDPVRSHGGGARWLRQQGLVVDGPVLAAECALLNEPFSIWAKKHRPMFVLKAAMTLDGRIATASGESRWITGPAARREGHRLRNRLDGILVGSGTVLADDPSLTARGRGFRDPVRIILDRRLRTPVSARLLPANSGSKARVVIATTLSLRSTKAKALVERGAELWSLPRTNEVAQLEALATQLADVGLCSVLVEGGGKVHESFLRAGLCDELRLYVAGKAVGGDRAPSWLGGQGVAALADAWRFRVAVSPIPMSEDLCLVGRPR